MKRSDRLDAYREILAARILEDEEALRAELVDDDLAITDETPAARAGHRWTRLPDGTWLFGRLGTVRPLDHGRRWIARYGPRRLGPYATFRAAQRALERLARAVDDE